MSELEQKLAAAEAERDRLAAIVAKLPKDAEGNPVPPGARLFFLHPETGSTITWIPNMIRHSTTVRSIRDADDLYELTISDCYLSCEAAEKAKANE